MQSRLALAAAFQPGSRPVRLAGGALAIWMAAASGHAQTHTFRTLAGNAANYGGSTDGTNSDGQFFGPTGVAVDSLGNLYVADQLNETIRKVTPTGTNWVVKTIAGSAGSSNFGGPIRDGTNSRALFNNPTGIAVDNWGNLFVADQYNNAIRKITPVGSNWVVTTIAGTSLSGTNDGLNSGARFSQPTGLVMDANSNIFVADQLNNTIRKMTPSGTNWVVSTIAGSPGVQGKADGTNGGASFDLPAGVAVDANGRIYVADQYNNTIRLITPSGQNWVVTTIAGTAKPGSNDGTNKAAQFDTPSGVAVDTNGNVYVTDQFNYTIRKMTPSGTNWVVSTIGGQPGTYGTNDGIGTNALFFYAFGLAVDREGSVYVADTDNDTIRKGYLAPTIVNSGAGFGFTQGHFGFHLTGPAGQLVVVDASTDLSNWTPIYTNTFGAVALAFSDPQAGVYPRRFYRAHLSAMIAGSGTGFGFSQGRFGFNLTGPPGQLVVVEASTNLVAWLPIYTNTFGTVPLLFSDPQASAYPHRFYRAHLP